MATATKPRRKPKPKPAYEWREGARFRVPAQAAGEELERIAAKNPAGMATPPAVVEESRPPDAVLHPVIFKDDDATAARLHREEIARSIIRSVRVVVIDDGNPCEPRIEWVHVEHPEEGPGYMTQARVMSEADLRRQVLADALGQLRGLRERYKHLVELGKVFDAIDDLPGPE